MSTLYDDKRVSTKNDFWNEIDSRVTMDGEVDVRYEIGKLLDKRGHYVFLRKFDTSQLCPCSRRGESDVFGSQITDNTTEADPDCPVCGGRGYLYFDYLTQARRLGYSAIGAFISAQEINRRTNIGELSVVNSVFFLKWDQKPTNKDQILEIEIDESTRLPVRPYNILNTFDIELAEENRDLEKGRIEYWTCYCKEVVV